MAQGSEHYHCADCGQVLLSGQVVYDGKHRLCEKCFELQDLATMPIEVKGVVFRAQASNINNEPAQ